MNNLDQEWLDRLNQYTHLYIGYSGGLDSTVLLNWITSYPELRSKVIAIHVHHGLSTNADAWALHCEQFCRSLKVPCKVVRVDVARGANLEERARIARYAAFDTYVKQQDALLLAHHQQDQCETVLLNLFRGTGLDGLCAMPEERRCGKGVLLRPFLHTSRLVLEDYAQNKQLTWLEDEMNRDCEWSRAFLRQTIIPLLQTKWPNLNRTVATAAQHCQEAKQAIESWIAPDCLALSAEKLEITAALKAEPTRCAQVLRKWLKQHLHYTPSRICIQEILKAVILASPDATPKMVFERWTLRRYQDTLYLTEDKKPPKNLVWVCFPDSISWSENESIMATLDEKQGIFIPQGCAVEIRVRQGGETLHWHGQTQSLKKLFQTWRIPPWERAYVPLLYVNAVLMAVIGYAQSDLILSNAPGERYTIATSKKTIRCLSSDDHASHCDYP